MALRKFLGKGVKLIGLMQHLKTGGVAGADFGVISEGIVRGSYDTKSKTFGTNSVTFHGDGSGKYPITFLPYRCGGINSCTVQGQEVISGPFTGCYMSLYNDTGGTLRCGHVDTESDGKGQKPSEETWRNLDYDILAETKTTVSDQLISTMTKKKIMDANKGFQIGVASGKPARIDLFDVLVTGSDLVIIGKA